MKEFAVFFRILLAVLTGKLFFIASRIAGTRGSSLPGLAALKIYPGLLGHYARQLKAGTIVVTGTNGKTTTNNLLIQALEKKGLKIIANREGANLARGVATAFLRNSSLVGTIAGFDWGCLEADEAAFPKICTAVRPKIVIITNFFRDQLDRYWEIDKTVEKIKGCLKQLPDTYAVLNADDPLVAQLGLDHDRSVFYGIGHPQPAFDHVSSIREARFCPRCGTGLSYEFFHYSQLGRYSCASCFFQRPRVDVDLSSIYNNHGAYKCHVTLGNQPRTFSMPAAPFYHIYNCLAVLATVHFLGFDLSDAEWAINHYQPVIGRMQQFNFFPRLVRLNLVKNPAGFNENIALLVKLAETTNVYIALNDQAADGRDISWIWDVNFEDLHRCGKLNHFYCSGRRAADMALRLKYAGIDTSRITILPRITTAVRAALNSPLPLFCLATYTALWPTEKAIRRFCPEHP